MDKIAAIISSAVSLGAASALMQLGVTSGELSFRKAREVYGAWFVRAVREGRITPVHVADGNGLQAYSVKDILSLKVEDAARAELYLKQSKRQ